MHPYDLFVYSLYVSETNMEFHMTQQSFTVQTSLVFLSHEFSQPTNAAEEHQTQCESQITQDDEYIVF